MFLSSYLKKEKKNFIGPHGNLVWPLNCQNHNSWGSGIPIRIQKSYIGQPKSPQIVTAYCFITKAYFFVFKGIYVFKIFLGSASLLKGN